MAKHTHFTGQPILGQLLSLIPATLVRQCVIKHDADRYCKRFFSADHLVSMLFASVTHCQSLRELTTGMLAAEHKLRHLSLMHSPRRSTLSEANNRRPEAFFGDLYHRLARHYLPPLPDSRQGSLFIVDSTTVSLFSNVLANAGRPGPDGRRKGGIKAHTLIRAEHGLPEFVHLSAAACHDAPFLKKLSLPKGSLICFDKGYIDYDLFAQWSAPDGPNIGFVSRLRKNATFEPTQELPVPDQMAKEGVLRDQWGIFGHTRHKDVSRFEGRLVTYRDPKEGKLFTFICNRRHLDALQITQIYYRRWQVELMYKRIKAAYPLKYFLGESANAIKIQLWCTLIADLLISVCQRATQRVWSYANIRSLIKLHWLTYVDLRAFLNNPEQALLAQKSQSSSAQMQLFSP